MTKTDEKREEGNIGGVLLKVLTANYNALVSARSDEAVLRQYSVLLRFLKSQPDDFLEVHAQTKQRNDKSLLLTGIRGEELQSVPLDELERLVNDDGISRKHLERIAIDRFSVPRGSMRSFSNRQMLVEKLRSLIDNERAHQIIGVVARGPQKEENVPTLLRTPEIQPRLKGDRMRHYIIFLDIMKSPSQPNEAPTYQVALHPHTQGAGVQGGAMGTKQYLTDKKAFIADLKQRLGYTDAAIERFFAGPDTHQSLLDHPLSDEDAAYFGWV
jgi:hypothetical protein